MSRCSLICKHLIIVLVIFSYQDRRCWGGEEGDDLINYSQVFVGSESKHDNRPACPD